MLMMNDEMRMLFDPSPPEEHKFGEILQTYIA